MAIRQNYTTGKAIHPFDTRNGLKNPRAYPSAAGKIRLGTIPEPKKQTHEGGDAQSLTTFHQLLVPTPVRGNEHNFGIPLLVDRRHKPDDVGPSSPLF